MGVFNKKILSSVIANICLLTAPILGYSGNSGLVQGNFTNINDSTPESVILNPTFLGMTATYQRVSDFYGREGHLPKADALLQKFPAHNPLNFITNRADGSILAQFSSNAGSLAGKNIRCLPPTTNDGIINFNAPPLCVTDVNYNNVGVSFLKYKLREFTPSPTLGNSNFLKSYTASTGNMLSMTYAQLSQAIKAANASATSTSSSDSNNGTTPAHVSNIISVF